jgi:trk system potassium uptake protein TrkH
MWGSAFRSLHHAVRPRVLARHLGQIGVVFAVLTVVPAAVSIVDGRFDIAWRYAGVIGVLGGLGVAGARVRCSDRMQANEAMVVSTLVFLVSGLVMAFPIAGYGVAPIDAVFESISGVTTTGLSTIESVGARPRAFLFARAWLQWVGGLGVVVLALAFVVPSGLAAKRLGFDDREAADYVGGARGHARRILWVYVVLTTAGIAACWLAGMDAFDAVAHGLAAISTGGFATSDASLSARTPVEQGVVMVVCMAGAVRFSLYYHGSLRRVLRSSRLWLLLGLTAVGASLLAPALLHGSGGGSWSDALRESVWMAMSAQSTAGFATLDIGAQQPAAKLVLIIGMLVGGEIGSTAGGLKIFRVQALAQLVISRILRASMPDHGYLAMRVDGIRLTTREIEGAAALALAYAATILVSWLAFLAYGHDPLDALFDVASAVGTVGLSSGVTGAGLEPVLKLVLCVDMLMGRVELFGFLVLIFPGTWIGRRSSST